MTEPLTEADLQAEATTHKDPADEVDPQEMEFVRIDMAWSNVFNSIIARAESLGIGGAPFGLVSEFYPAGQEEDDEDYGDYKIRVLAPRGTDGTNRDIAIVNLYYNEAHVSTYIATTTWNSGQMDHPNVQALEMVELAREISVLEIAIEAERIVSDPQAEVEGISLHDEEPEIPANAIFPPPAEYGGPEQDTGFEIPVNHVFPPITGYGEGKNN